VRKFPPNVDKKSGTGVSPVQAQAKACGYQNSSSNVTWY